MGRTAVVTSSLLAVLDQSSLRSAAFEAEQARESRSKVAQPSTTHSAHSDARLNSWRLRSALHISQASPLATSHLLSNLRRQELPGRISSAGEGTGLGEGMDVHGGYYKSPSLRSLVLPS
jgi:hypothetical protein